MRTLTQIAHDGLRGKLKDGDIAIDATAGNGHDTLFLAGCVGPAGKVFAFDIQKVALERTAAYLGLFKNVNLLERSHAEMRESIPAEFHGHIAAVMFNFGYLPNSDKSIVTSAASSVAAVNATVALLRPGGWLSAILYTGHPGGAEEAEAVEAVLRELPFEWVCEISDRANAPRLWIGHSS